MDYNYYHYTKLMLEAELERVLKLPAAPKNLAETLGGAIEVYRMLEEMYK